MGLKQWRSGDEEWGHFWGKTDHSGQIGVIFGVIFGDKMVGISGSGQKWKNFHIFLWIFLGLGFKV